MLVVTVVLVVQALLFADGGLTALGINVLNMAVVTAVVGWLVFRLPGSASSRRPGAALVAGVAAFLSVPASALAFVAEYALGGTAPVSLATQSPPPWAGARADRHRRGDHHWPGRGGSSGLEADIVAGAGHGSGAPGSADGSGASMKRLLIIGGLIAVTLAAVVSLYASSAPDGLNKVAEDHGIAANEQESATGSSPLAGYS